MHTYNPPVSSPVANQTINFRDIEVPNSETPIQQVGLRIGGKRRNVYLKLEGYNHGGSIKHRTALALIEQLETSGQLRKGGHIIESSSGNLAVSLAMLSLERGYRFTAVVDPMVSEEKIKRIHSLGASTILVRNPDENGGYLINRLECIRKMISEDPELVWTNQYHNPANPNAHYSGIAPEIFRQMEEKVDVVFIAVSTGGTLSGVSRYFRKKSPDTRIIAVDAKGSIALGGQPSVRKLSGIGSSRRSQFISSDLYDELIYVGDAEAFAFCRKIKSAARIMIGGSSGACLAACARYLSEEVHAKRAVCICADDGNLYASSIFNDSWLEQNGIDIISEPLCSAIEVTI